MGSSGMKKKGRQHLPKVGTPKQQNYALHKEQQAVVSNFGASSKGWMFWGAIAILAIVVISMISWIFLF